MSEARAVRLVTPSYQGEPKPLPAWNLAQKIAFRFFFAFFALHEFPYPLSLVPWLGGKVQGVWAPFWNDGVSWVGAHILHLAQPIAEATEPNGSGDRLFSWVEHGCFAAWALIICVVWSVLDRKRPHYRKLHGWLCIGLRFSLASQIIGYGALKVIPNQFPFPTSARLLERVGEMSPMGLLWTFIGFSPAYQIFGGLGELVGGVLLYFRRTTTLGAVILIGVLSNVVVLNFSYDVPVKIYSSHLLMMALYLVAGDLQRILDIFVFNRAAAPVDLRPPYSSRGLLLAGYLLKTYLICTVTWGEIHGSYELHNNISVKLPELEANWKVEELTRDGVAVPATDGARWNYLSFVFGRVIRVRAVDDSQSFLRLLEKPDEHALVTTETAKGDEVTTWVYSLPLLDPNELTLEGTFHGAKTVIKLKRFEEGPGSLTKRGFHFVNDVPFNH